MPDQFGRLSLLEMRTYILRNITVYSAATVNSTTGFESGTAIIGQNAQFSSDNLNLRINSQTTKASILIQLNNDKTLGKEIFFDAIPGVFQYQMPVDMVQLRGLWWKDPGVNVSIATPENYVPMSNQDTFEDGGLITGMNVSRPTYRIVGNIFQLNQDPGDFTQGINQQGIWVRYIKRLTYLINDTDVLNFPFANEVQEYIVWGATHDLITTQEEMVDDAKVVETFQYWSSQLELLVRNQYRPPEIQLKLPSLIKNTFSGR